MGGRRADDCRRIGVKYRETVQIVDPGLWSIWRISPVGTGTFQAQAHERERMTQPSRRSLVRPAPSRPDETNETRNRPSPVAGTLWLPGIVIWRNGCFQRLTQLPYLIATLSTKSAASHQASKDYHFGR